MADDGVEVVVDSRVKQRLEKITTISDTCSLGYLYGEIISDKARIFGCVACRNSNPPSKSGFLGIPDWKIEYPELSAIVPTGLQLCGIYYSCVKPGNLEANYLDKVITGGHFEDPLSTSGKFLVLQICTSNECEDSCRCFVYDRQGGCIMQCTYQEADIFDEFLEARTSFRILANIQISSDCNKDDDDGSTDIAWKIEQSCQKLSSMSAVYHVKDCNMLLSNQSNTNVGLSKSSCAENCDALLGAIQHIQDKMFSIPGVTKNRGKQKGVKAISSSSGPKSKDFLEVRLLHQLTETDNIEESFVPIIQFKKAKVKCVDINLPVDALLNIPRRTPLKELPKLFTSAICCQLRKMASVVEEFSRDGVFSAPSVFHFKPPGFCNLVTAVYPGVMSNGNKMNDEDLTSCRVELHKRLLLPENRPLMRPSNAYLFENEKQQGIYLTNPHDGLAKGSRGTVALVDGKYAYHHYMQDNFNDDGWGCAYRSLQTICSWFRYQGYTSKPVPAHREIQQALVDLQDKSVEFVGSRQWIGSFEVSMCLEHLIGVTSKIMFVSSGAEMPTKARDLFHHFQTQGTPVMIGGGVLAHTILGVDFNDQTGDIRFLILDPHYTGGEDLKLILDKGWCGWKGADFWNQQAHYNMCMPQRPDMV